jgi:hypothetical protein
MTACTNQETLPTEGALSPAIKTMMGSEIRMIAATIQDVL